MQKQMLKGPNKDNLYLKNTQFILSMLKLNKDSSKYILGSVN